MYYKLLGIVRFFVRHNDSHQINRTRHWCIHIRTLSLTNRTRKMYKNFCTLQFTGNKLIGYSNEKSFKLQFSRICVNLMQ